MIVFICFGAHSTDPDDAVVRHAKNWTGQRLRRAAENDWATAFHLRRRAAGAASRSVSSGRIIHQTSLRQTGNRSGEGSPPS